MQNFNKSGSQNQPTKGPPARPANPSRPDNLFKPDNPPRSTNPSRSNNPTKPTRPNNPPRPPRPPRSPRSKQSKQAQHAQNLQDLKKTIRGIIHVQTTLNNTIITVTNAKGTVVGWSSAGSCGFKGARKSTPFAAKQAAEAAARHALDHNLHQVKVMLKGAGPGRDNAVRGLLDAGVTIAILQDVTGLPHNGCRRPKKRRV